MNFGKIKKDKPNNAIELDSKKPDIQYAHRKPFNGQSIFKVPDKASKKRNSIFTIFNIFLFISSSYKVSSYIFPLC